MADHVDLEREKRQEVRPAGSEPVPAEPERQGFFRRHPKVKWALLALAVVAAIGGYFAYRYYASRETTDDAQIDGHIDPISARVGGTVIAVNVNDNEHVNVGQVLVQIDPSDYQVAVERAKANLAAAEAAAHAAQTTVPITSTTTSSNIGTAEANVATARAGVNAAENEVAAAKAALNSAEAKLRESQARNTLAQQNLKRMELLVAKDEISRQQYDTAMAESRSAAAAVAAQEAAVAQARQAVAVAESHVAQAQGTLGQAQAGLRAAQTAPQQVAVSEARARTAQAEIQQAKAALDQAELNLSYTTIKAPVHGVVSKKTVEIGQVIQPGQPLMALIPLDDIWVTANFKETDLKNMRPGEKAEFSVDALGGRKYRGYVQSIAAATGARFSLLPPENATGNYVKVVQRVPVKIVLNPGENKDELLRPGMSVEATVFTNTGKK
jgi:membrane fusion protein (multidrug efflux system)